MSVRLYLRQISTTPAHTLPLALLFAAEKSPAIHWLLCDMVLLMMCEVTFIRIVTGNTSQVLPELPEEVVRFRKHLFNPPLIASVCVLFRRTSDTFRR